ncbi:hypothetical protein [Streptomyces antimycoticus]|uniref:hypothetical protein n=1 Tax=Streptomyces antimycoticus TaxID=68175 RepID=UPI002570FFAA|nr:hypothetical protein [Streptomyces antimycoticus]WJE00675.1 hypothetical protein QR300_34485 [Streptomyces antimycoticus]
MTDVERSAPDIIERFLESFANISTRSQRCTYLQEYLEYLGSRNHHTKNQFTLNEILAHDNVAAWLAAAWRGDTRQRSGTRGPRAAPNSMAARITTINTFSRFCGAPLNLSRPRPRFAKRLASVEAHRALRLLANHQPAGMQTATWQRSVAVVAVTVCTRRGLAKLHNMKLHDVALEGTLPHVCVAGQWYPLDSLSRSLLTRWLHTHRSLTTGRRIILQGNGLWLTTNPNRSRESHSVPTALPSAKLRTLQAAHRRLMIQVLGLPLLLEQFSGSSES